MRIFVSGVHATGKTTLVHELSKMLVDAKVINLDQWYNYRQDYFHGQIDRLVHASRSLRDRGGLVLSDRSHHDVLVYSHALWEHHYLTDEEFNSIVSIFQLLLPRGDSGTIFLFPDLRFILETIERRGREASTIMYDPDFVKCLYQGFTKYHEILRYLEPCMIPPCPNGFPEPLKVLHQLECEGWIQPRDIIPEYRLKGWDA